MKPKPTEKPTAPLAPGAVPFYRKEISVPPALRNIPRKPILLVGVGIVTMGSSLSIFADGADSDTTGVGWRVILGMTAMFVGIGLVTGGVLLGTSRTRSARELSRLDLHVGGLSGVGVDEATHWVVGLILFILLLPFFTLAAGIQWLIGEIGWLPGLAAPLTAVAIVWFVARYIPIPAKKAPREETAGPRSHERLPPKVCPGCGHVYEGAARVVRTCRTCGAHLPD